MKKIESLPGVYTCIIPFGTAVFSGLGAPGSFSTPIEGIHLWYVKACDALLSKGGVDLCP